MALHESPWQVHLYYKSWLMSTRVAQTMHHNVNTWSTDYDLHQLAQVCQIMENIGTNVTHYRLHCQNYVLQTIDYIETN